MYCDYCGSIDVITTDGMSSCRECGFVMKRIFEEDDVEMLPTQSLALFEKKATLNQSLNTWTVGEESLRPIFENIFESQTKESRKRTLDGFFFF